ncbi:MAG TPA: pitrilysin family protein [Polyangiaceae bacterium]
MSQAIASTTPLPKLLVETSRELPLVSVSIALRTGALEEPPEMEGATRLLARLMRRSAGGRSAEQNDALVESMGASLGAEVTPSTLIFQGAVISRSLERFFEFLLEVIGRATLPEDELQRLKRETEAELVETLDDDRGLARRWFRRRLFEGHPYSRSSGGTLGGLGKTSLEALRALYRRVFVPENIVVSLSGDVTRERAEAFVSALARELVAGPAPRDATPHPTIAPGRRLVFVDKPERTQTQILIGGLGSHPSDPDHFALALANTAFGGTFTARLMQEVRVKRGWSYGAYSSLPYDRRRQAFSLWTFPKASDAPACVALELELLHALREGGITKGELGWARRYLVRSHAFAIDTAAKRAGLALDAELYELPEGYYERYLEHLQAVTLEQANQALRERLSDDDLLISIVGTESEVGAAVREAIPNLAKSEVVRYDAD